jgi:hypothetical protein
VENQVPLRPRRHAPRGRIQGPGRSRPRALATLRNLTADLIRQSGHGDIAATIRDAEYDNDLLYAMLRITPVP